MECGLQLSMLAVPGTQDSQACRRKMQTVGALNRLTIAAPSEQALD